MSKRRQVALLSVFRKEGIVEFARSLRQLGFRLLASGGTAKALKEAGIPVTDVSSLTGRKAILGHKVVTLSGEVHAGLLADYVTEVEEMAKLNLPFIDLVCIDLYPLQDEITGRVQRANRSSNSPTSVGRRCCARGPKAGASSSVTRTIARLSWTGSGLGCPTKTTSGPVSSPRPRQRSASTALPRRPTTAVALSKGSSGRKRRNAATARTGSSRPRLSTRPAPMIRSPSTGSGRSAGARRATTTSVIWTDCWRP